MRHFSNELLANTMRIRRKEFGLTQNQLGIMTHINRSTICLIEKQQFIPSIGQLVSICNTLDIDPAVLLIQEK